MKSTLPRHFKKSVQVASLVLIACASIIPVGGTAASSHRVKNRPVIKVGVYNYAGVARLELRVAERKAASFFAPAGVRIAWSEYSRKRLSVPSGRPAPDFSVRIFYASSIKRSNRTLGPDALGQSIMPSGIQGTVPGRIANVFYDRVETISLLWGLSPRDVLGDTLAHELGHLMLGAEHSRHGIMKAPWTSRDLELANRGELRFSPEQAAALQHAARSLREGRSLTVTAQR